METFRASGEKLGVTVKGFYYTVGHHDIVVVRMEATDEAGVMAGAS